MSVVITAAWLAGYSLPGHARAALSAGLIALFAVGVLVSLLPQFRRMAWPKEVPPRFLYVSSFCYLMACYDSATIAESHANGFATLQWLVLTFAFYLPALGISLVHKRGRLTTMLYIPILILGIYLHQSP